MFGSTSPFGQSSSSPFASQSVFGQTNNTNTNPFAPSPSFGNVTPFGSQTSGSIFGGTSTGVFGAAQSSSPFSSTTAFGASSSPAFGSSSPSFGSSSTPGFGSSSSSFGASPVFGQKPAFGFGSTTPQSSPFGSTTQQSQPAFGSSIFGSTQSAFSATSTPAFGATSTPAFGATSTPAFGSTASPAFGSTGAAFGVSNAPVFGAGGTFGASSTPTFGTSSTPAFGASSTPAFGASSTPSFSFGSAFGQSTPAFGSFGAPSTPAFGATATPAFGATSTPAFGSTSTPAFGSTSTPAFGATSTPAFGSTGSAFGTPNTSVFGAGGTFGASSTPAFGASSTPSFSFGSSPAFGQSTPAFGSSPFGTTTFGAQSSSFGSQSSAPAFGSTSFGQSPFGGQRGGSRITPYAPTTEADGGSGTQPAGKLESISAMPAYKDKSHEELRWEDYQSGDKGGPNPAAQPAAGIGFGVSTTTSNPFGSTSTFGQTSASPFSSSITNPFSLKPPSFNSPGFTTSATASNPFQSTPSSLFGPTPSMTTSIFGSSSTPTFGTGSSLFGSSATPSFSTSPSIFGTGVAPATTPTFGTGLNFSGSQTSPLFSSTPAIGQTGNAFGQVTSTFGQNTNFGQSNIFNTPSTGFSGNMFSNTPSFALSSTPAPFGQTTPSFSSPFQPAQTSGAFSFSNFGQTQPGGGSSIFGLSNIGLSSATQSASVAQPFTNPYGTLPAMPQISIGRTGAAPSVQYGISSMPVVDKPLPVRISPLLTSRYLSQRRIRLPARKYRPDKDSLKVPFFSDDEETPSVPKADALFFPRENPRSLIIRPTENWSSRASAEKGLPLKDASAPVHENGKNSYDCGSKAEDKDENHGENGHVKDQTNPIKGNQGANGVQDDHSAEKEDSYKTICGHRAGEAAIVYEHGADIEALMPKLRRSDYFTEPRIQVLAAGERAEPGYCRRVKDFVVGRHGYGSIKFLGETDVRCLDLESLIQFNNREVIVYLDDSKKPHVGQGLNKPAEVTLLNIKCFDKKTAEQYTEGARVEKYKNMLKRKAEEQGAEFLSYDPIKGEWKFKVDHFSTYKLEDEDKDHL